MLIKEFRVVLPFTVEEYRIAQLYSVAQASVNVTGGGDGVQVLVNELFENKPLIGSQYASGQYTKKKYFIANKVGAFVRALLPKSALVLEEEAWNAYPYCKTVLTNNYMGADFGITIETLHLPGKGDLANVHRLPPETLSQREVILIDIAKDLTHPSDYDASEDPRLYHSQKSGRGPLQVGWINNAEPIMTCYKLVTCHFNWFGLQTRVEKLIQSYQQRVFTRFHRKLFCWMDDWFDLTIDDIRRIENETQASLDREREHGTERAIRID